MIGEDWQGDRSGGDLADGDLGDELIAADAPEHVAAAYLEHAAGRRAIVFTPTVAVARLMADALNDAGVAAAWVSGETPRDERAATLGALRDGSVRVVANAALLTEGFDLPQLGCVVVARPTKSTALYQQMIGRGTRLHPGKRDCLVLDVVGQAGRHDLVTVPGLFGVTARGGMRGRTVTEVLDEQGREDAARDRHEEQRRHGRLVSRPVELFKQRPLHWVEASDASYVLSIPDGRIRLQQGRRGWSVAIARYGAVPAVIARDLPLPYAQGLAEDRARSMAAAQLVDPNAAWRQRPASEKQLAVLRRRGLLYGRSGLTAGEASDLIAAGRRGA